MNINNNKKWIQDIDKVIEPIPELSCLQGKTVMITGATGLICSAVTDMLIRYNEKHNQTIGIVVAGRNREKTREKFGLFLDKKYMNFVEFDATNPNNKISADVDYIIHGASNAFPARIAKEPVETMLSNFLGTKELLDYSIKHQINRFLYISSSEVYGAKDNLHPFLENDYGSIDILNARNSYSVSKRAAETLCMSYANEYGADFVVVRPGHIYGPTASPEDNRVSSAWAYLAARGKDIVIKSNGEQIRSYCYCLDCASAILKVLLTGQRSEAYNISNPDSIITIKQIAELYAKFGGVHIKYNTPTELEEVAFNPMLNSSLNSNKLQELGWKGLFTPEDGVQHTIAILKEII